MAGAEPVGHIHPFLDVVVLRKLKFRSRLAQLHANAGIVNLDAVAKRRLTNRGKEFVGGIGEPIDGAVQPVEAPVRDHADQVCVIQGLCGKLLPVRVCDQASAKMELRCGLRVELDCCRKCRGCSHELTAIQTHNHLYHARSYGQRSRGGIDVYGWIRAMHPVRTHLA